MPTRTYRVQGRVQGVWYRASTQRQAQQLGLSGWVRNLPSGEVELEASGEAAALDALQAWLWQGPPLARVDEVLVADSEHQYQGSFEIRQDGA